MAPEHVDVLVVGAGLSGIGAACRLLEGRPGTSLLLLESRADLGGTWDLFRYPGIRSDSDMYTLAFPFAPWTDEQSIADGGKILAYLRRTAQQHGVDRLIRYGQRVEAASWSSTEQRWTVRVATATGPTAYTCSFLYLCTGYYDYERGHVVDFPGQEDFAGTLVHPQHWPAELPVEGRRFLVIGSGATAVTLVPALAERGAAHVTMLQRSPTYVVTLPGRDAVANLLRRAAGPRVAHRLTRGKNIALNALSYQLARRFPQGSRAALQTMARRQLPDGYDMANFTPRYAPWDERLCVVPDGDLFAAVGSGRAEVVTGTVERFTPDGVRLVDGRELPADVIVTATGLQLKIAGGVVLDVDGVVHRPAESYVYKGCMQGGVPNLVWTVGYINASWTLRADLVARYVVRLLRFMDEHGLGSATPRYRGRTDVGAPLLDLSAGYVQRAAHLLPKQGDGQPWVLRQNYVVDSRVMAGPVDDGHLEWAPTAAPTP